MAYFSTHDLVGRAAKILADPDLSPYPVTIAGPLKALLDVMLDAAKRHGGPPPGFDKLRDVAVAIIDDSNAKQQPAA